MLPFIYSFAQLLLFFQWKLVNRAAFHAAAAMVFYSAIITLNKKQVAAVVLAVGMCIAGLAADVALGKDIPCNALTKAVVEDKVLPLEF